MSYEDQEEDERCHVVHPSGSDGCQKPKGHRGFHHGYRLVWPHGADEPMTADDAARAAMTLAFWPWSLWWDVRW